MSPDPRGGGPARGSAPGARRLTSVKARDGVPSVEPTSPTEPREDLAWEDVVVGQTMTTPSHIVTDEGIAAFAAVTLDQHPLHTDDDFARSMGFPRRIAHGLYGLSLMEGLKTKLK